MLWLRAQFIGVNLLVEKFMTCMSSIGVCTSQFGPTALCTQLPKVHFTNLACQLPASFYGFSAMSVALTSKNCQKEKKMVLSISYTIPYETMATNVVSRAVEIYLWFISYRPTFFSSSEHILLWNLCVEVLEEWTESMQIGNLLGSVDSLSNVLFLRALLAHTLSSGFVLRMCTL